MNHYAIWSELDSTDCGFSMVTAEQEYRALELPYYRDVASRIVFNYTGHTFAQHQEVFGPDSLQHSRKLLVGLLSCMGVTQVEIAQMLGRTHTTIGHHCRSLGLLKGRKKSEELSFLCSYAKAELPNSDIFHLTLNQAIEALWSICEAYSVSYNDILAIVRFSHTLLSQSTHYYIPHYMRAISLLAAHENLRRDIVEVLDKVESRAYNALIEMEAREFGLYVQEVWTKEDFPSPWIE